MANISQTDWLRMVASMGPGPAEEWRRAQGVTVGEEPMPEATPPPGDGPPSGALGMPEDMVGGALDQSSVLRQMLQLQKDTMSTERAQREQRRAMFEQARAALEQQRLGPSRAEQLFALSAAFAAPQRYKGFGGMMANVMPALSDVAAVRRQSDAKRTDALERLRAEYLSDEMAGDRQSLSTRRQNLSELAQMAKTKDPRIITPQPGGGAFSLDENGKIVTLIEPNPGDQKFGAPVPEGGAPAPIARTVGGVTAYMGRNGKWYDNPEEAANAGGPTQPASGGFRE